MKEILKFVYKVLVYLVLLISVVIGLVLGVVLSPSLLSKKVRKSKSYGNFMLFAFASVATFQINILSFIYTLFVPPDIGYSKLWLNMAISEDQAANVKNSVPFNDLLLSVDGRCFTHLEFGNPDETISSNIGEAVVLTENSKIPMLSVLGKDINKILNFLDKNHSVKSIEVDEI